MPHEDSKSTLNLLWSITRSLSATFTHKYKFFTLAQVSDQSSRRPAVRGHYFRLKSRCLYYQESQG